MADTLSNVALPNNTWVDLYDATGITVGTRILVQNLGSDVIRLTTQAATPLITHDAFQELHFSTNIGMVNDTGDLGAWAFSENVEGLVNVRVFL